MGWWRSVEREGKREEMAMRKHRKLDRQDHEQTCKQNFNSKLSRKPNLLPEASYEPMEEGVEFIHNAEYWKPER